MAAPITVGGLTFSDERGGFILTSVTGSGTLEDPFVIAETVTGNQEAILVIRGASRKFGNYIHSQHAFGIAVRKLVTNATPQTWRSFSMELRETMEAHSPYEDGLSFGQGSEVGRPFKSSDFNSVMEHAEPFDNLDFAEGAVVPTQQVTFDFVISDSTPQDQIILIQQPLREISWNETPASVPQLAHR